MSLRLSSLDPSEPRAAKDCRTCNRRRIRCDRSLPTCKKCALKNLPCPGYGLRIQWGQGVASRGKLTGRSLPVLNASGRDGGYGSASSLPLATPGASPDSSSSRRGSQSASDEAPTTGALLSPNPAYDANDFHNEFAINLDLSSYPLPPYLQQKAVRDLVHYYDHVVATCMPWVDGPENAWRRLLLPLAMESEALLLAVVALSAEHHSSKLGSTWSTETGSSLAIVYRDHSLKLLAQSLRTEIREDSTLVRRGPASAMLATIMVLCNVEMIRCDSSIWRVHWKAARTITRLWWSSHHSDPAYEGTFRFLVKEAFVYDVFGCTTTFGDHDDFIPGSIVADHESGVFIEWLQLIQEVTQAERRRHNNSSSSKNASSRIGPLEHLADMRVLQGRFDAARIASIKSSTTIDFGSPAVEKDFIVMIDVFHHAGLLYSYQALLDQHETVAAREACTREVIRTIRSVQNSNAFQHDFVWPLFVIGTASRQSPKTQAFLERMFLDTMSSTGWSNCRPALEFLRRFWASDPRVVVDWMHFARQESRQGSHFLVI